MNWLGKLFGKDERTEFARAVLKHLTETHPQMKPTLNLEKFEIVLEGSGDGQGQTIFLDNFYSEYVAAPPKEKATAIAAFCSSVLFSDLNIPDTYEEASAILVPRVMPKVEWFARNLEMQTMQTMQKTQEKSGAGANQADLSPTDVESPFLPLHDFYGCGLCLDLPQTLLFVNNGQLKKWGVSLDQAYKVALTNLAKINPDVEFYSPTKGVYISQWSDTHDASRVLLTDTIRKLSVVGSHVAMLPHRNVLIVTGSEDIAGLGAMLHIAEQQANVPRAMITQPLHLVGDEWRDFAVPPSHPLFGELKKHRILTWAACYEIQAHSLNRFFEGQKRDVFVATLMVMEKAGKLMTACTWSKGVEAYLPKAEFIAFTNGPKMVGMYTWDSVQKAVGDLMQPTDFFPTRYHVNSYPDAGQMQAFEKAM